MTFKQWPGSKAYYL